jgi:DNA-nicking Smr family endonuclease
MGSNNSNKKPPNLDEASVGDLEKMFRDELGDYADEEGDEQPAEERPRFSDDEDEAQTSDRSNDGTPAKGDFGQLRAALEEQRGSDEAGADHANTGDEPEDFAAFFEESGIDESDDDGRRKLTHEEMMAEAFGSIGDDSAVHAEKFRGAGYKVDDDVEIVDDLELEEELGGEREERSAEEPSKDDFLFYEMMASEDVRPMSSKTIEPDQGKVQQAKWRTIRELTELSEKDLYEPDLTMLQRERLKRSRNEAMPVLNIRGQRRKEAMLDVRKFVAGAYRREIPYVRIITGKGRHSEGLPVLKKTVIEWVENHGGHEFASGWAPETDRSGNYGSVVLELRRRK